MSHQLSDSSAARRRRALNGRAVTHEPDRYQNDHGDIVVPAEIGEIVLLPRLWDFELVHDEDGAVTLTSRSGLIAVAALSPSVPASVDEVMTRPSAVANLLDARAT